MDSICLVTLIHALYYESCFCLNMFSHHKPPREWHFKTVFVLLYRNNIITCMDLCMCVCIYVYVCMYICVYVCIYIYM